MPGKSYFRYQKGRTLIESNSDNKAAIKLAYLNTILGWLLRLLAIVAIHKLLS